MNSVIVLPDWVKAAQKMPIYFSQVREDALIDLQVSRLLGKDLKVIMIASGGCTAATLAASDFISVLHMVDTNPSQLALTKLKLKLLNTASKRERLSVLGYIKMDPFQDTLTLDSLIEEMDLKPEIFGDPQIVNALGLDFCGRYEQVFEQLRRELRPYQADLAKLLALRNPVKQCNYISEDSVLGYGLRAAFEKVMALPNLRILFGEAATRNRRISFAEHFFERTRNIFCTQPAATNPYLHSILGETNNKFSPWIEMQRPNRMPSLSFLESDMFSVLSELRCKYDFIHLSNICDWLGEEEAKELLTECYSRLNYGGIVLIRQLNSILDIPSLLTRFDWQTDLSEELLNIDRSFFYHSIHVGVKS